MSTDLEVVKTTAINTLGKTKAQLVLDAYSRYFGIAAEWEVEAKSIVVTDESQTELINKAEKGRKFLSKERTSLEATRKELKDESLNEGRVIDSIANTLKGLIEPIEKHLKAQEDFAENQKKMRVQKLHKERFEKIRDYIDIPNTYEFGTMTEEIFNALFAAKKKAFEDRKEAEAALERERIANIEREKEGRKKIDEENARLRKENEEKDRLTKIEREKMQKKLDDEKAKKAKEFAKIREENDRITRELQAKAEAERKARIAVEEQLKNTVTCPNCQHKFMVERK